MPDLITITEAQTALGTLADSPDLAGTIAGVSAAIVACFPATAPAADFIETLPVESSRVRLSRRPITRIDRVASRIRGTLTVARTGQATRASVEVTPTGLTLRTVYRGAPTTATVTFASNPAVDQLATAINAIGGWAAAAGPGLADAASLDLEIVGPIPALGRAAPLDSFGRDLTDFATDLNTGGLWIPEPFPKAQRLPDRLWGADPREAEVRVWYRAGHETIPADIKRATIAWLADVLTANSKPDAIRRERSDDYEYELAQAPGPVPSRVQGFLRNYRRTEIT